MKRLLSDLWSGEPTLILGLLRAIVVFSVLLFMHWTPEQSAAAYAIVESLTSWYNRSKVTPV